MTIWCLYLTGIYIFPYVQIIMLVIPAGTTTISWSLNSIWRSADNDHLLINAIDRTVVSYDSRWIT